MEIDARDIELWWTHDPKTQTGRRFMEVALAVHTSPYSGDRSDWPGDERVPHSVYCRLDLFARRADRETRADMATWVDTGAARARLSQDARPEVKRWALWQHRGADKAEPAEAMEAAKRLAELKKQTVHLLTIGSPASCTSRLVTLSQVCGYVKKQKNTLAKKPGLPAPAIRREGRGQENQYAWEPMRAFLLLNWPRFAPVIPEECPGEESPPTHTLRGLSTRKG